MSGWSKKTEATVETRGQLRFRALRYIPGIEPLRNAPLDGRVNFLCLQVCLGESAQETLLGGVYLPDLLQSRLKSGCLAAADGEVMQVD